MKKSSLIAIAFLFLGFAASAQIRYGIKAGLSSDNLGKKEVAVSNGTLGIKDAKYGFHFGVFARAGKKFYIQPELLFNSSTVDLRFSDLSVDKIFTEKYRNLDVPLMVGYKMGKVFRVQTGPVAHIHLSSKSELEDLDDFDEDFKRLTLGWQAGVGLDLWKVLVDLKYEGNFSKFGDHIMVAGEEVNFDTSPSRLILSLGFSF